MSNKTDYTTAKKQHGEVTLGKLTVALINDAIADNYGTNPTRVCYYAPAIDTNGNKYQVRWETTPEWDEAQEYAYLESQSDLNDDDQARLAELKEKGVIDPGDEGNACDWDNPEAISKI